MVAKIDARFEALNAARDERYRSPEWHMYLGWNNTQEIVSHIWMVGGLVVIIIASLFVLHMPNRAVLDTDTVLGLCGLAMSMLGGARLYRQRHIYKHRYFEAEEEIAAKLASENRKGAV